MYPVTKAQWVSDYEIDDILAVADHVRKVWEGR